MLDQLGATNGDLLLINIISTCFGHLYAHRQENRLRSTAYGCLSFVAVAMLESRVARCVHCVENVAVRSVLLTMGIKMPETC